MVDRTVGHTALRREPAHGEPLRSHVDDEPFGDVQHLIEVVYTRSRHDRSVMEQMLHNKGAADARSQAARSQAWPGVAREASGYGGGGHGVP
ncbi:hypothetical protein GCM10027174_31520 [Salinifilum aidingensis]